MSSWKRDAASGLIVLLPILVTLYIVSWLYRQIAKVPLPVPKTVPGGIPPELLKVGVTIVVFVLLVLAVGYLMRTAIGSLVENGIDNAANRIPGLRVVYNASKMAAETAISGPGELQKPVKIEVLDGIRMTAFKTGKISKDGREIMFMPTAPNITTGFVIEVDDDRITETNESVEDALTRILSAGFGETKASGIDIEVTEEGTAVSD